MNGIPHFGVDWQRFGLSRNPYDERPLDGSEIPIGQLFVGRERERKDLDMILGSDSRSCTAICGNVGVGKTSFANYVKSLWKHEGTDFLFSAPTEIEANEDGLTKQKFILGIIANTLREIELIDPGLIKQEKRLQDLQQLVSAVTRIERSLELSAGIGMLSGGFDKDGFFQTASRRVFNE